MPGIILLPEEDAKKCSTLTCNSGESIHSSILSTNQSINQPLNYSVDKSVNQSIKNQSIKPICD